MQRTPSRRVGDRRAQFGERRASASGVDDSAQRAIRRIVEDRLGDWSMFIPRLVALSADGQRFVEGIAGLVEQLRQVDRMLPRGGLLHPLRSGDRRNDRTEDVRRVVPADGVEQLAGFVGKVERVADVHEGVVGRSRKDQVGKLLLVEAGGGSGAQTPFCSVARADFGETSEPGAKLLWTVFVGVECRNVEVGRLTLHAARDMHDSLVERARSISSVEVRQHVRHRSQNRQPAGPSGGAILDAKAGRLCQDQVFASCLAQTDHRLGDHQPQVLLKPLRQLARAVGDRFLLLWLGVEPDFAVANLRAECGHVVGKQVKGASAGEVELGMVPVTGQDAIGDGPLAQWKAHMRTAVIDRKDLIAVPEHGSRALTRGDDAHAVVLQILK